jgi:hypothetical protein
MFLTPAGAGGLSSSFFSLFTYIICYAYWDTPILTPFYGISTLELIIPTCTLAFVLSIDICIIYSFYKYNLISLYNFFPNPISHLSLYNIEDYSCKKAKDMVDAFLRYALIEQQHL